MLELFMLPTIVVGVIAYVTWIEIKTNRPFKRAVIEGLVSGIVLAIVFYCIELGRR